MFTFEDGAQIHAHWMVGGNGRDVMATIWTNPGEQVQGKVRVKFQDGDRQWYTMPVKPLDEMIAVGHEMIQGLREKLLGGDRAHVLHIRDTDTEGLLAWMGEQAEKGRINLREISEVDAAEPHQQKYHTVDLPKTTDVDLPKTTDLMNRVKAALEEIPDWGDPDWGELLKSATASAAVNAMLNETADGFFIPNIANVHRGESPEMVEVPDVQGQDLVDWLSALGREKQADAVSFSYVTPDEFIAILLLTPVAAYKVIGRIQGTSFVRTEFSVTRP